MADYAAWRRGCVRPLKGFADVERIAGRIALRNARPGIWPACGNPRPAGRSARAAGGDTGPLLESLATELATPPTPLDLLTRGIAAEPGAQIPRRRVIAPGYDAELDELRALNDNCGSFLVAWNRERERTGIANPQGRIQPRCTASTSKSPRQCRQGSRRPSASPDLKNAERYITPS